MKDHENMQAIILNGFGGVEHFSAATLPLPEPGDTEVLVQIAATAFNPIDYQMRQGAPESKRMHSPILGRECAGIVLKTGELVTGFAPGDAVLAASGSMGSNGSYATHISLPAEILVHKPHNISFAEAAAVPTASLTALQCYKRLQLPTNAGIFISGAAGGVGLVLVKLLLAAGYTGLIVTAGNEASREQLLLAGLTAEQVIDYRQPELIATILKYNNGRKFDAAIDLVGGHLSEICAEILRTNGIYQDVTALTTAAGRATLFNKGIVIMNISNYAYSLDGNLSYYGDGLRQITALLERGAITPSPVYVTGTFSVETVQQSHELLERNQSRGRKLVMTVLPDAH
ncbi:NADP-dependent oxidoreductase [Chitinophaga sp.]|uniref:quinone oxidoreductase family protein n=1 Tax=Chitinophaga sp. TaxID=1869181 RepID=UPI0025C68F8D|nr:NADP-dependent oxidoreductase [Chitinophaga sp.]